MNQVQNNLLWTSCFQNEICMYEICNFLNHIATIHHYFTRENITDILITDVLFFFFKRKKNPHSQDLWGGSNSGTVWEAGAFKYSCWRLNSKRSHEPISLFSTAPKELTQICFSRNFQKAFINKKKEGKPWASYIRFRFIWLSANSNSCGIRNQLVD